MILWDHANQVGALAHLSYPQAAQDQTMGAHATVEVKMLNHTVRHRDTMLSRMGSEPMNVCVLLWRGHGFGRNPNLPQTDVVQNLPWGHFADLQDLTAWGDPATPGQYSLPYRDASSVYFDPATGIAYFPRNR